MKILMRTNITKTPMELFQSPTKFYVRPIQDDVQGFAPISWICKRERYVCIYNVESFFWGGALEQLYGILSDIGAHLEFQNLEFVLPELLLKELWC